jgi:hypothetical protein
VRSTELESGEYEEEDEEDNPTPRTPHPAPLHPVHPLILDILILTLPHKATINAKNREKFAFQVLTKDFKYVILILIRKNYLLPQ